MAERTKIVNTRLGSPVPFGDLGTGEAYIYASQRDAEPLKPYIKIARDKAVSLTHGGTHRTGLRDTANCLPVRLTEVHVEIGR